MKNIVQAGEKIIVGVDTHKDVPAAVMVDRLGVPTEERFTLAGPDSRPTRVGPFPRVVDVFGVGDCGSYDISPYRFLRQHRRRVIEVDRIPPGG